MAKKRTRQKVLEMTERGLSPREIATLLGLSTQAVYHHLTILRNEGKLPAEEAAS